MKFVLEVDLEREPTMGQLEEHVRALVEGLFEHVPKESPACIHFELYPTEDFHIIAEAHVDNRDGPVSGRIVMIKAPFDTKKYAKGNPSNVVEVGSLNSRLFKLIKTLLDRGDNK